MFPVPTARYLIALLAMANLMLAAPASAGVCWRGKPMPECRTFLVTELGVYRRLDEDPTQASDNPIFFSLDVGLMKNISPVAAVGGTAYGGTGDGHARVGARFRYRRWLSRNASVDVAPGFLAYGSEDGGYSYQFPGLVLGTTVNWRDWIALGVEVEHSRYRTFALREHVTDTTWRAGAKLGSAPGVLGTAVLVGFFVYLVSTLEN